MREGDTWSKPIYLPYLQPELTDEVLQSAEEKLGCTVPKELIELLRVQNGGYIRMSLEDRLTKELIELGHTSLH